MVQAMIDIEERTNRVLNVIKALHSLRTKSQAIDYAMRAYEDKFLQPELRPEFIKEMQELEKNGKFMEYSSIKELRKVIEHKSS